MPVQVDFVPHHPTSLHLHGKEGQRVEIHVTRSSCMKYFVTTTVTSLTRVVDASWTTTPPQGPPVHGADVSWADVSGASPWRTAPCCTWLASPYHGLRIPNLADLLHAARKNLPAGPDSGVVARLSMVPHVEGADFASLGQIDTNPDKLNTRVSSRLARRKLGWIKKGSVFTMQFLFSCIHSTYFRILAYPWFAELRASPAGHQRPDSTTHISSFGLH